MVFRVFFGWVICVQACVRASGGQYMKQTNSKFVKGDYVEAGNSDLLEELEELDVVELDVVIA